MNKTRGKRSGLKARSKNARKAKQTAKFPMPGEEDFQPLTRFWPVHTDTPVDGCLLLVRLTDGSFRFGMMLQGHFANYDYHAEEFVTMPHPERITHYMIVIDPVPRARPEHWEPTAEEAAQARAIGEEMAREDGLLAQDDCR